MVNRVPENATKLTKCKTTSRNSKRHRWARAIHKELYYYTICSRTLGEDTDQDSNSTANSSRRLGSTTKVHFNSTDLGPVLLELYYYTICSICTCTIPYVLHRTCSKYTAVSTRSPTGLDHTTSQLGPHNFSTTHRPNVIAPTGRLTVVKFYFSTG